MSESGNAVENEELDFFNLILMLGNTAAVELGEAAPKGGKQQQNIPRARQFINMLAVLEKKTEGRRTPQEEEVLKRLLADLREKYIKASGLDAIDPQTLGLGHMAAQAYARAKRP